MKVLWHSDEANQSKLRLFFSDRKESSKQWREDSLKIEIVAINTNYGSRQQKELKMEQLNDATFEEFCLYTTSQNVKTYFCVFRKKVLFRFGVHLPLRHRQQLMH